MCLLFLYLNDDPDQSDFRLIVANNRDMYWNRPTDTAKFRGEHQQWIGGIDLVPGRVGGTWLGLSSNGKFVTLLNITAKREGGKNGKGHLVESYLCGNESVSDYLRLLKEEISQYSPF